MSEWIPVESAPHHGQKVRTRGADGREYDCEYFHWSPEQYPYFKMIGSVWDHDNVTRWKPLGE